MRRSGSAGLQTQFGNQGAVLKGAHYGADKMMCADIANYLRGQTNSLPASILDVMEASIAAIAVDQARNSG